MSNNPEIAFKDLIDALLDIDTPFHPRFLYRLSDLEPVEIEMLAAIWPQLPLRRRQAFMEDLESIRNADSLLSYEAIGRYAIADEDPKVRQLAVQILYELDSTDLAQILLKLLDQDPDVMVRATAATGLGRFVYLGELDEIPEESLHTIEDELLELINGEEPAEVRLRALESVGYSSREEVPELIEAAFASGDKDWMAASLLAMGRSADERWQGTVLKMLDHRLPLLGVEAARAAGELEISEANPTLFELIRDPTADVRAAAIWSLSQIGGEGVRETLENLLAEADEEEEADFLESALDNLAFTEGMQPLSLFDFPEGDEETDGFDLLEDDDELFEFDDQDEVDDFLDNVEDDDEEDEEFLD